ncbi:MAG: hypothetical protein ACSHWU_07340 [Marinicella sp.]
MKTIKFIIISSLTLTMGCTSVPKTELQNLPSLIEIIVLDLSQPALNIRVSHRNKTPRLSNKLNCQLAIKDQSPIKFNGISVPDLSTFATETLRVNITQNELPVIPEKQKELPYVLDCYLESENFRTEHIIKKATLFRVPGRLNEFR